MITILIYQLIYYIIYQLKQFIGSLPTFKNKLAIKMIKFINFYTVFEQDKYSDRYTCQLYVSGLAFDLSQFSICDNLSQFSSFQDDIFV